MARRGENIYRRKDGRWEGRYIKGRDISGKAIYGYIYENKYLDCRKRLLQAKMLYAHSGKIHKRCGTGTVSDFMVYWLNGVAKLHVKASTYSNYAASVNKWIIPLLGKKKLSSLKQEDIQFFVGTLSEQNLSAGTVRNIYRIVYTAMKKAVEFGYLRENPSEGIQLPEMERKEARLLTLQEQKKLEQAANKSKNGFAILLALYTGMRVGEICALTWKDVDLEKGVIFVSNTLRRIQCFPPKAKKKTELIIGSAKTYHSARTIPLPAGIFKLFKEHKKTTTSKYVFSYHNHPLEPRVLQYRFKTLLEKAGLKKINFHALRHTFATRCMELCFDIKTLSEILGHASAKMTLDRYGHSQIEHKLRAMRVLDQIFNEPQEA